MTDDTGFGEFKPDSDPLTELVERIRTNTTVAYEKASIEMLAKLKVHDLARYMKVFAELKQLESVSIGTLRRAIDKAGDPTLEALYRQLAEMETGHASFLEEKLRIP